MYIVTEKVRTEVNAVMNPAFYIHYNLEFMHRETGPLVQSATGEHLPRPTKTARDPNDPPEDMWGPGPRGRPHLEIMSENVTFIDSTLL